MTNTKYVIFCKEQNNPISDWDYFRNEEFKTREEVEEFLIIERALDVKFKKDYDYVVFEQIDFDKLTVINNQRMLTL